MNLAGSSNGRTTDFGSVYLGSSPSPAANFKEKNKPMLGLPFKWIIDSLNIIKEENDAPLAGGFTGAVMNVLGRVLLYPDGEDGNKSKDCFYEFIEKYLKECDPRYLIYKEVLWKFLRCDGAHNVLAQYAVVFTGDSREESKHLTIHSDIIGLDGRALLIFLPEFIDDLKWSVEKFSYNLEQDTLLQEKHRKVVNRLLHEGQQYINDKFPSS